MKLTHPAAIKSAALLTSMALKAWFTTLSQRVVIDEHDADPHHAVRPALYMFWHEMMLAPAVNYARTRIPVLMSEHRDGELIAQIVRMLGGTSIRGSTNKRGDTALRRMMRQAKRGHIAITPDGPRGPRRHVAVGSIYLASRTGMRIVPMGFAFSRCWRVGSWDKMALPKPFCLLQTVIGRAISIPGDIHRRDLEPFRAQVQSAMDQAQERAERLVERYAPRTSCWTYTHEEAESHPARPLQQVLIH